MVADPSGRSVILEWVGTTDATDNDGSKRELKVTYNDADAHIGEIEAAADYQRYYKLYYSTGLYNDSPAEDKKDTTVMKDFIKN